jgi:hypothetical protein
VEPIFGDKWVITKRFGPWWVLCPDSLGSKGHCGCVERASYEDAVKYVRGELKKAVASPVVRNASGA